MTTTPTQRCIICRREVLPEQELYCATRHADKGLVCPECLVLVRKDHTDTLRKLAESGSVW